MTREQIIAALRQLEQLFSDRLTIVRIVIDHDRKEIARVSRVTEPPRRDHA